MFALRNISSHLVNLKNKVKCLNFHFHSYPVLRKNNDNEEYNITNDKAHEDFAKFVFKVPLYGHNVFVVQPKVKWGPAKKTLNSVTLQLEEAVTLIKTLDHWSVSGKCIITVKDERKKEYFSPKAIIEIRSAIAKAKNVSAVFVSVNMLNGLQHRHIESELHMPVYDRYTIVLQIFSEHASSQEAKIQVALAEIPYLRSRLRLLHEQGTHGRESGRMAFIGGPGETIISKRRQLLLERETNLKKLLNKLREKRQLLRQNRQRMEIPVVAVVGYTNAGKTALIKSITEDINMEPRDKLFATLDVTAHAGKLSNFQKVLFMDTIGFISDIPLALIESFTATLEDVALSDLIVHVRDFSHPDRVYQKETVLATLKQLNLNSKLLDTMIEVGNKIDLFGDENDFKSEENLFPISAKTGFGVGDLRKEIQKRIICNKGLLECRFRVPMGGVETAWLYKFGSVAKTEADDNVNYLLIDCIMTEANLFKFKHLFGEKYFLPSELQTVN